MALPVGAQAPDFTLPDANKTPTSLSSFRGKQAVLLVFYPFAFSVRCTAELCQLRDDLSAFQNERVQVLAISTDTSQSLKAWAEMQGYSFPLLSDFWPHGAVRFSEANGPGEARDQSAWKRAVAALPVAAG